MVTAENSKDTALMTLLAILVITISAGVTHAIGEPGGPDTLEEQRTERYTTLDPNTTQAQAGNLTELNMTATSATKGWQGFFGNISGTITLEDSDGDTFYDWTTNEPEGEVYASTNETIQWSTTRCFGFNDDASLNTEINLSTEENRTGFNASDEDGIDETFDRTDHPTFYVGTNKISGSTCPSTNPYVNNQSQTSDFYNVLLEDDGESLIFTSILENRDPANDTDKVGYDGNTYDFQMLTAEDEHTQAAAGSTTYYFWVEIE